LPSVAGVRAVGLIGFRGTVDGGEERTMGRMLDALKRADRSNAEPDGRPNTTPDVASTFPPEAPLKREEEIPFIEVGPRKSVEASPSVLASASVTAPLSARVESLSLTPRTVQFRALPVSRGRPSPFAPELVAFHAPEQIAARHYRVVLDAVRNASAPNPGAKIFLFTAFRTGIGNTTTLLNLAITAAREGGERVLVVDANLRQPAVAERLGLPAALGLRDVLAGSIALEHAVQPTEQPNLFALTAGVSECGWSSHLSSQEETQPRFVAQTMRSLLRQLRTLFQLVFVDGPPREGRPEGMMLDGACDALFLVLPEREAETPQVDALLQSISHQGGRLAGCVLVAGHAF
jgi:Mrp family chromosome partitioning ATPase